MSLFSGMSADTSADASADALCIIILTIVEWGEEIHLKECTRPELTHYSTLVVLVTLCTKIC